MRNSQRRQYTVRGVPKRVDAALRKKATQEGVSLNAAALEALARGLGLADEPIVHRDLDDIAGTWVDDPAFDAAIRAMDTVDPDLWR
jgi:hypothetical protein